MNATSVGRREPRTLRRVAVVARAHAGKLSLAALCALAFALLLYVGRGNIFFYDEWALIEERSRWNAESFLAPSNEHLLLVPIAVYKVMWATVGLGTYWPYRVLPAALVVVCGVLVYAVARRTVPPSIAVVAASVSVLFLGAGWEDTIWGIGMVWLIPIAACLGMLLALDRRTTPSDVVACLLVALAVGSGSLGISVAAVAAVETLARPGRRTRVWIAVVPMLAYGLWWLRYGHTSSMFRISNVFDAPRYVADAFAGVVGAITGLGFAWGQTLAVVAVAAAVVVAIRRFDGRPPLRFWSLLGGAFSFWALAALFRGGLGAPSASRYLLPGAVFLVLAAVQLASGVVIRARHVLVLASAALVAAVANLGPLGAGRDLINDASRRTAAQLAVVELYGDSLTPEFQPAPVTTPQLRSGPYLDAVRRYGSPALPVADLDEVDPPAGRAADLTLSRALALGLRRAGQQPSLGAPPRVVSPVVGDAVRRGACIRLHGREAVVAVGPPGAVVTAGRAGPVAVAFGRFGRGESVPLGSVSAGDTAILRLPPDRSRVPSRLRLDPRGGADVCGLAG